MNPRNAADQVDTLEQAILQRAQVLAEEQISQGNRARERILEASSEKLRLLEDRELLAAKAQSEREYRRLVQASEIQRQAELDGLRWALVESVMEGVGAALAELTADEARYLPVFKALLTQAASSIGEEELVATVNEIDHRRFAERWDKMARAAVPERRVSLSAEFAACTGGVRVNSKDERINVDNTFEGRIERLEAKLHTLILERLFPSAVHMGPLFRG
ncbi:MAG: V-type ATP synthase subunit E [Acidiferrobacterales bacterium]